MHGPQETVTQADMSQTIAWIEMACPALQERCIACSGSVAVVKSHPASKCSVGWGAHSESWQQQHCLHARSSALATQTLAYSWLLVWYDPHNKIELLPLHDAAHSGLLSRMLLMLIAHDWDVKLQHRGHDEVVSRLSVT